MKAFRIFVIFTLLNFNNLALSDTNFNGKTLKKVGSALYEYSIFGIDIYILSYYKSENAEILEIHYQRDISKDISNEGWKVGFEQNIKDLNQFKEQIEWLKSKTPDVKENDRLQLIKNKSEFILKHNGKVIAKKNDSKLVQIAYLPWLGENSVDEKAKKKLLGGS